MSFTIKDGAGATTALKTSLDGGEHVKHVNIDASALPTGAATAANQTAGTAELTTIRSTLTTMSTALAKLAESSAQKNNFGSNLMLVDTESSAPVATNGAAGSITPALADPAKKIVVDLVEFWEDDSGTIGTNNGRLAAGDVLTLTLSEESGATLLRRSIVCVAADPSNRIVTIAPMRPIKLSTANKKLQARLLVVDSGGSAKNRNLKGQINVWYREEA